MGDIQFDHFKRTLQDAIADIDFVRKNTLMQDATFAQQVSERISSLTFDQNVKEGWEIESTSPDSLLYSDPLNRRITFDPKGFSIALSRFREGVVETPGKIWGRTAPTDDIYYILSDQDKGILMLGEQLEVIRLFPGFGPAVLANREYDEVSSAITFTVGVTEYLAVAMVGHHVIYLYNYTTGAWVSEIGTVDTPGTPDVNLLDSPVDLAFNPTTNELWVACESGMPPGATAANGFLVSYDLTAPAAPVLIGVSAYYETDGSLLHREVNNPQGLYFDTTLDALWVANAGPSEIGAISDSDGNLVKFFESRTLNYSLSAPGSIRIRDLGAGTRWLYVANTNYGSIEVFDIQTQRHLYTFGFRSTEDTATSQTEFVFGSIGQATGVFPAVTTIDGVDTATIVVSDALNGRVQRINEDAFKTTNYVNFAPRTFLVPLHVIGWAVTGDVPTDLCSVYYKTSTTDDWHLLDDRTHVPYSSWFQFRLEVKLDRGRIVRPWHVKELTIIGEQV
jgi:hypothetical protein